MTTLDSSPSDVLILRTGHCSSRETHLGPGGFLGYLDVHSQSAELVSNSVSIQTL